MRGRATAFLLRDRMRGSSREAKFGGLIELSGAMLSARGDIKVSNKGPLRFILLVKSLSLVAVVVAWRRHFSQTKLLHATPKLSDARTLD